ncbi:MAG TPA: flagellar hook-associated protein FlgL [Hyphomicrobiales bacterium]|nr:flagellar hook-associated protein FlgL [Hyphomicrobiales bacterium]
MRISTSQLYNLSLAAMQSQQAKLQKTELQIASGLRILQPSDDPAGAVQVLNLNTNMGLVDQYERNASQAGAMLGYEESVLENVNSTLQRIRELVVQANNPINHDGARKDIGLEIQQRLEELLVLGNTRDQNGEYLFAGNRTDQRPFTEQNGTYTYQGDAGTRQIQVGEGAKVAIRESGATLFMQVPTGNGTIAVSPEAGNTGTLLVGQYGTRKDYVEDTYQVRFFLQGSDLHYEVTDSAAPPTVVDGGPYAQGKSLAFNGIDIALSGAPQDGDTLTVEPAGSDSLFAMVDRIAAALITPTANTADRVKVQAAMAQGLANLDQALEGVNVRRASIGARLNNIDTASSINQDFRLQLDTVKSQVQDLDYAEALTRFNLQLVSLQAAQQAFIKTSELSLFNYL